MNLTMNPDQPPTPSQNNADATTRMNHTNSSSSASLQHNRHLQEGGAEAEQRSREQQLHLGRALVLTRCLQGTKREAATSQPADTLATTRKRSLGVSHCSTPTDSAWLSCAGVAKREAEAE